MPKTKKVKKIKITKKIKQKKIAIKKAKTLY